MSASTPNNPTREHPEPSTIDTATACRPVAIESVVAHIDDLLSVVRHGDGNLILQAVRRDLADALDWRTEEMAGADAADSEFDNLLQGEAEAIEAVAIVRAARRAFGDGWPHVLPATAWRARGHVHLLILAAEHDPVALELALNRIYGPER